MTALLRDGNVWQHPDFDVLLCGNGIAIETERDTLVLRTVADARDLIQALTQAVQAAELASVTQSSEVVVK